MKKFIIITVISVIVIIALSKLIWSPEPLTPSKLSRIESERYGEVPDSKRYDLSEQRYNSDDETKENSRISTEITNRKLRAFAKAFVEVQSYMDRVGSKADSRETAKIVKKNGLSVEDYTSIAILMNKSPAFRERAQKLINEVIDSNY